MPVAKSSAVLLRRAAVGLQAVWVLGRQVLALTMGLRAGVLASSHA